MLVVTCGDHHTVLAKLHNRVYYPHTSSSLPWNIQHMINSMVLMGIIIDRTEETSNVSSHYESVRISCSYKLEYIYNYMCVCSVLLYVCMYAYVYMCR